MNRVFSLAFVSCLAVATAVFAQPAPATQPVALDATTPKGALMLYSRAMISGDIAGVPDLIHATTPQEKKIASVLLDRPVLLARFRKAVVKAFSEEVAAQLTGVDEGSAAQADQRISQAEVTIDNDKATLRIKGEPEAAELVKVDGKWKLSMAAVAKGMTEAETDEGIAELKLLSNVMSQIIDEIDQGKFKTPQEVDLAIRGRLASAKLAQAAAEPATRPAP